MKTTTSADDALAEVWAIKDSLSAKFGHDLQATCRVLYSEQQKHPENFVNLGADRKQNKTLPIPDVMAAVVQSPI